MNPTVSRPGPPWLALAAASLLAVACCAAAADPQEIDDRFRESLSTYLETFDLGTDARSQLDAAGGWSLEKQHLCLKLLSRLAAAPSNLSIGWVSSAGEAAAAAADPSGFHDRLVRARGRAVFVAPVPLPPEQAELHDRTSFDLVRLVASDGMPIDVMTSSAPRHWPRSKPIDMPAEVVGLAVGRPQRPDSPAASLEIPGPPGPAAMFVVAPRVAWFPDTPLGNLGMDYGLFDTVSDGRRLVPGDSDSFYAMLSAVGRATQEGIEAAAPERLDVIPLIDAGTKWIEKHRGEAVRITGVARRATRIEVDDPIRREQIGGDHYWELFVFVDTPTIRVGERIQDDFPIVCCVRRLPKEMPAGDPMGERVEIPGFVMKRYAYPLPAGEAGKVARRETPLVIGKQAIWLPDPSTRRLSATLGWIFSGLSAVVLAGLAAAALAFLRGSRRRSREPLPDRIQLDDTVDQSVDQSTDRR